MEATSYDAQKGREGPCPKCHQCRGGGWEEELKTPQCSMDTASVASVPTLGGQWPEDWCGVTGPTSPSVPAVFSLCGLYLDTHSFFFLKDNGIKMKKLFSCVSLFHSGVRAVCCGCSVAGGILVPRPGLEPTAPTLEALDHQGSPFSLFFKGFLIPLGSSRQSRIVFLL